MNFVHRISLEHFVLSDQTDGTLGEKHLVAELDWCAHLPAFDQVCMRLEERIEFLCSGHLFAVEHATARLVNYSPAEATIMLDVGADAFDLKGKWAGLWRASWRSSQRHLWRSSPPLR